MLSLFSGYFMPFFWIL